MAMPALEPHYWTSAGVRALPEDGNRYECIDGELLVTPSPSFEHQYTVLELAVLLRPYVRGHSLGDLAVSPSDVEIEPATLVQPDVFVAVSREGSKIRSWNEIGSLLLAVEVLSSSTARYDRVVKRRFYQRAGVGEYWIADNDSRVIERWVGREERPEIAAVELIWTPKLGIEPLRIDVAEMFARALD